MSKTVSRHDCIAKAVVGILPWIVFSSCRENSVSATSRLNPPPSTTFETAKAPEIAVSGHLIPIESELHDFGNVMEGRELVHTFRLQHAGDGAVRIGKVLADCSCTLSSISIVENSAVHTPYELGSLVPNGAEVEVTATISTKGKRGPLVTALHLLDGDQAVLDLELHAEIQTFLTFSPPELDLGVVGKNGGQGRAIISSLLLKEYTVSVDDVSLPPGLQVDIQSGPTDERGNRTFVVIATLAANTPIDDRFFARVPLLVTCEDSAYRGQSSAMNIIVRAAIVGPIVVAPTYLSFGRMRPDQVEVRTTAITARDRGTDLSLLNPRLSLRGTRGAFEYPESITFELIAGAEAYELQVTVSKLKTKRPGPFRGVIEVEIDSPEMRMIEIPFFGVTTL